MNASSVLPLPTCTSPLVIGQTYLDLWGAPATIHGHVKTGSSFGKNTYDPNRVWCPNRHYDIKTGVATDGSHLVNLAPADEVAFWTERLASIRAVNPPDKLKLVQDGLDRIEARLRELQS